MAQKAGLEIHADLKALRKELKTAVSEFKQFNSDAIRAATGVRTLESATDSAAKKVGFFNTTWGRLTTSITGGFLGAGAVTRVMAFFRDWGGAILTASSNLQELDSKARVVFGETFPQVEARVQSIAAEVGRADSAILQFSADMGAVIDAAGLTQEATAGMSTELAKLAVDLASFHNTSDIEAFNALRSAITGELEPLKRFGVVMTQANLQAFALTKGIKQKVETMTQAQLTALRYNYILERTTTAQGDAARTAGSYANQSRRLQGELTELNEQLGRSATPALASGLAVLNSTIQNVRIFVSLLISDLKSLFSMLNVNIGASSMGQIVKDAAMSAVTAINPIAGAWLNSKGKTAAQTSIQSRIDEVKAQEATETGALPLPSLEEMMKQYAGGNGGGGAAGAKKAADELLKAEEEILKAMSEEAKLNLDNLRLRREDLMLRQKLGLITRQEEQELARINGRLEFQDEVMDDLVKKWEDQGTAIEASAEKLKDLRKELRALQDDLQRSLKEIDQDTAKRRQDRVNELMEEKRKLTAKWAWGENLTGGESLRLGQIEDELRGVTETEMTKGDKYAGMSELERIDAEAQDKKNQLIEDEKTKREELLQKIADERDRLKTLRDESVQMEKDIAAALDERRVKTETNYKLIQEATRNHVTAMIGELSKLQQKYREVGVSPGSLTIPDTSGSAGAVTNNSTSNVTVNQNNYGEAANNASDARSIRWTLKKNS